MRNLFYIAAIAVVVAACSDDTENEQKTTFSLKVANQNVELYDIISGYIDEQEHSIKIAEHGNITCDENSEVITAKTVLSVNVDSIYIWYKINIAHLGLERVPVRIGKPFKLIKNTENILDVGNYTDRDIFYYQFFFYGLPPEYPFN
jgi:hypothetical protein